MGKYKVRTDERHLRWYNRFIELRNADQDKKYTSNYKYYDKIAEEEKYDSDTIRRACNRLSKKFAVK